MGSSDTFEIPADRLLIPRVPDALDVARIAARMTLEKRADLKEILPDLTTEEALLAILEESHRALVFDVDFEPVAMAGVIPATIPNIGLVWTAWTEDSMRMPKLKLRTAIRVVDDWAQHYPILMGFAPPEPVVARWLQRLGFAIVGPYENRWQFMRATTWGSRLRQ